MPIAPEYLHLVHPGVQFHAFLYGRSSRDPKKKGRSVEDQLTDGCALCDRFEWHIAEQFKDTGFSASRHARRDRDEFETLLDAIENTPAIPGVIRLCVAYEASRYYRDLEAYVRLRNACYNAGVLLCYNGTIYDLSKREDRRATAQDAINAEDEADAIQDRNSRTARLTAEKGGVWGKCPFGYARRYDESTGELIGQYEHPVHGPIVTAAFQHIDAGKSLNSLVRKLEKDPDAKRPDGAEWNDNLVKYLLLNRAYLGERLHHGKAVKAVWAPLKGLDGTEGRALFRRVGKTLTDPSRGERRDSRAAHLLSHLTWCAQHDILMKAENHGANSYKNRRIYKCRRADVSIGEYLLDAFVEEALLTWLGRKDTARAALIPDQGQIAEEVRQAQERLDVYQGELEEARKLARTRTDDGRPLLSLAALSQTELDLLPKIEELEARLQKATGVPLLVQQLLSVADPEDVWNGSEGRPGLTLEQKREVIRQTVTVRVLKATRSGARGLDPNRVELSFVGTPGFRAPQSRARGTSLGLVPGTVHVQEQR